jgi:hypothetical protein
VWQASHQFLPRFISLHTGHFSIATPHQISYQKQRSSAYNFQLQDKHISVKFPVRYQRALVFAKKKPDLQGPAFWFTAGMKINRP